MFLWAGGQNTPQLTKPLPSIEQEPDWWTILIKCVSHLQQRIYFFLHSLEGKLMGRGGVDGGDRFVYRNIFFIIWAEKLNVKSRFILPQQSICQSIFKRKAPHYLTHSRDWPLIRYIPDSSPQFISNVTFGTSLAFQMREEYMLIFIFFNLDHTGVNIGATQFCTQFTHVSKYSEA